MINIGSPWKKLVAPEIIKQTSMLSSSEKLSHFMREAEDRVLNFLSATSFSPIFFLKGEITHDCFGSVQITQLNQPPVGRFIFFTVYKLSPLKKLIIS